MGICRAKESPGPDRLKCDLLNPNCLRHFRTSQWPRQGAVCRAHRDKGRKGQGRDSEMVEREGGDEGTIMSVGLGLLNCIIRRTSFMCIFEY